MFAKNNPYLRSLLIQVLFIPFLGLAILFFKGGTVNDPTTVGYSFYKNFISELGAFTAHNGEFNNPPSLSLVKVQYPCTFRIISQ